MRVLVSGASGFIGSRVVRKLVADSHEVVALGREGSSFARLDDLAGRFRITEWDSGTTELRAALGPWRPESCVHLAWYAEPGKYLDAEAENVGSMVFALRLLDELATAQCKHVVMVGTCAEYDPDAGILREDSPTRPATIYAAAKLATGLIGALRAAQVGVGFAWARIFYLYGPQEDARRMLPTLIRSQLDGTEFPATAGEQIRDYLHVDDVAAALCLLAVRQAVGTFNVCSGEPISVRRFMLAAAEVTGHPELIRFGALPARNWEPALIAGDCSKLKAATGWQPSHTLPEGLKDTVAWWQRQRPLPQRT